VKSDWKGNMQEARGRNAWHKRTQTALLTIHFYFAQHQVGRAAGSDEEQVSTLHARPIAPDASRRVGGQAAVGAGGARRVLGGREGGRAAHGRRDVRHADLAI